MNNNDLRVKRTRKLLMGVLLDSLSVKPIEKITVIDICETAMVNRATFYAHFEDKYALLNACIDDFFKPYISDDIPEHTIEGLEKYYTGVVRDILVQFEANIKNFRALINQNNSLHQLIVEYLESKLTEKCNLLEECGVTLPAPVDIISSFYAGAIYNVISNWVLSDHRIPAKEVAKHLSVLFDGISKI